MAKSSLAPEEHDEAQRSTGWASRSEAAACRPHRDVTGQIVEPAEHDLAAVLEPGVRLETRAGLFLTPIRSSLRCPARKQDASGQSLRQASRTGSACWLCARPRRRRRRGRRHRGGARRLSDPPRPTQQNLERQSHEQEQAARRSIRSHRLRAGNCRKRLRSVMLALRTADRDRRTRARTAHLVRRRLPDADAPPQSVAPVLLRITKTSPSRSPRAFNLCHRETVVTLPWAEPRAAPRRLQ